MLILKLIASLTLLASQGDTTQYSRYETVSVVKFRDAVKFAYPAEDFQGADATDPNAGNKVVNPEDVVYDQPMKLGYLLKRAENTGSGELLAGYRVQVYAGGDLKEANEIRADFIELFPDISNYRLWVQPTFRIRVGDYVSRSNASLFCNQLRKHFPGAFVVPDKVKKPKIRKYREIKEEDLEEPGEEIEDEENNN